MYTSREKIVLATGIILFIALCSGLYYSLQRNDQVYELHSHINQRVLDCSIEDIRATPPRDSDWRRDTFDSVTYNDMMISFQSVCILSFWKDTSFIVSGKE